MLEQTNAKGEGWSLQRLKDGSWALQLEVNGEYVEIDKRIVAELFGPFSAEITRLVGHWANLLQQTNEGIQVASPPELNLDLKMKVGFKMGASVVTEFALTNMRNAVDAALAGAPVPALEIRKADENAKKITVVEKGSSGRRSTKVH